MNKFIVILGLGCFIASCDIRNSKQKNGSSDAAITDSTTVQVIDSAYNFGTVTDGDKVEYNFRFRNTGKNPLVIESAVASCGCTVPEKPEHPIMPGETGFLKVVFNSKGRPGDVYKTITVRSNARPNFPLLQLRGNVKADDKEAN